MSATAPVSKTTGSPAALPLAIAFAASVVVVSGVSLVYPVLPVISSSFGIDESQIGLVIAAFTLPAVVLAPLFGMVADSLGRRWLLILGLLVFAGGGVAASAAPSFTWLLVWRAVQGIGMSALSPLTIVLLSDLCRDRDTELDAQGKKVAIDRVAMIALPLIGGAVAAYSWRLTFLPFALVFIVAITAFFYMPETRPPGLFDTRQYIRSIGVALTDKRVSLAFAVGFFRFFLDYGFFIYLPLFLHLRYGASVFIGGAMIAISALGAIVTAVTVRRLSRLASIERLLAFAFAITGVGLTVILLRPPLWAIAIGTFAIGLGNGLISPLQKSMLTRNSPPQLRGGVISCDRVVQQIAKSLAPSLLGMLLVLAHLEAAFVALACVSSIGVLMMLVAERHTTEGV